jgi:hypothetical protein
MTREEALKVANEMHQWVKTDREKEALETLIPELKESEDERIIKTLQEYVKSRNWNLGGPTQDEVLAWLKKKKYDRMKPIYDARESFESALEKAWNDYHNGYENVDKLEDDYVECAHAKGFREGYLFGIEKQKPIIGIDQLKSLMLQYLQEAANEKDDSDIEADTDKWARKILGYDLEQKPVWSEEDEAHVEFILESLEDQIRFCKKDAEGANYAKQIRTAQNWLKALHERFNIQPKPECDNETEVQKAYNAGRKEVFDHPEYYGLQLRRMYDYETGKKNPEWSEEDKQWLSEVYFAIDHSMYSEDERQAMKKYIDNLRSQTKPKQERNEEDEKVRKWLLEYFYLHRDDLRGASVTSMEILSFLENHPWKGEEDIDESEFNPKPGEKFWVRCKTNKTVNLWFDKDDERPAYAVTDPSGIITYIVHIKKDGTGNCVSYQNKEKFLETFDILESKR